MPQAEGGASAARRRLAHLTTEVLWVSTLVLWIVISTAIVAFLGCLLLLWPGDGDDDFF